MKLLDIKDSILVIIDIQEKLVSAVQEGAIIAENVSKLASSAGILNIPVIISEQYPKGLGKTVPQVKTSLPENTKLIEKTSFSLMQENSFTEILKNSAKKQIILCGIEAHICVYQTAVELINAGYDVTIVKDACSSRNKSDFDTGTEAMKNTGAKISCLEMVLFELLRTSSHSEFKRIQSLIK